MKNIAQLSQDLINSLREGRAAIMGRGGDIAPDAGFRDFSDATYNIPADNAIITKVYKDLFINIPQNATPYAYISSIGGYSLRDDDERTLKNQTVREIYSSSMGDWVDSIQIPQEFLSLPGYCEGIPNTQYYNKVDLIKNKYLLMIDTYTFNGTEPLGNLNKGWGNVVTEGSPYNYYRIQIAKYGTYLDNVVVSNLFDYADIGSGTLDAGVDVINSHSGASASYIAIRPHEVESFTVSTFMNWLKENPITVKVARAIPEEIALPVKMKTLLNIQNCDVIDCNIVGSDPPVETILQLRNQ